MRRWKSRMKARGASELKRSSLALNHNGKWSFGNSKISAYSTEYRNNIGATGRSEATDTIIEGNLTTPFTLGVEHQFAVGDQWKRQELTNTDTIGRAPIDYAGNAVSGSDLEVDTWALFVEDELKLHRTLALTLARAWTTMRSSVATSARAPTWSGIRPSNGPSAVAFPRASARPA